MVDMSKFEITDASAMPKQTRTRSTRANPFTKAILESDAERHDEDGKSLGKPKQTGVLSTVKPEGGGPSELDTARNLLRRAAKDAEIGIVTRVQPVDDNSAILVFAASDRRVLQTVPRDEIKAAVKDGAKNAATPVVEAVKAATGTNPPAKETVSASAGSASGRDRATARR